MKIAVLGTGKVGRTLAGKLASLGHDAVVGETWLADIGPDTPLGHFTVEITFETETRVRFLVTGGAIAGRSETMECTTTQLRDGLYVVRWTEPDSNDHVTHIEDYTNGACMASSVIGGEFVQLHGTWSKVR